LRRGPSAVYNLHAYPVFVTKYRRPVFTNTMLTSCEQLMREVCTGVGAELREFNGETNYVHLTRALPNPSRPVGASQPPQRRHVPPAPPAIPLACAEILVEQSLLVTVLLRRLLRRCTADYHQAIHRPAEPLRPKPARYGGR
jgi:Transposase IS200 like